MANLLDTLLFDDPSPKEREALRERFEEEPDLAQAWAHWREVRSVFREQLEERVSDRRLLVLYVMAEDGYGEALTTSERAALDAARDDIAHAIETVPALEQVVERIRDERSDFEAVWDAQFDERSVPVSGRERASARARTDRSARTPKSQDASTARWTRRFALASLVVGISVGLVFFWWQGASSTTVTVAEGEVQTVELGTGATARLVGAAHFTYPARSADDGPYRVTLEEGRAFFDVSPREEGAFVVNTPTAKASVLGTQFGVSTRADTTEVVLASGTVQLEATGETKTQNVVLEPGQKSWVAKGAGPAAPTPADLTTALNWTGLFVFRSVPMETIVDRLRRHYEVSIQVAPELAQEPVTGTFEQEQSVQEVLNALAATLGADVSREDEEYRLVP